MKPKLRRKTGYHNDMNDFDFSNLFMNKETIILLKRADSEEQIHYDVKYDDLLKNGFMKYDRYESDSIGNQLPINDTISITEKGKSFLSFYRKKQFDFYFPIAVSILSLIISVIAIIKS